jgi:RNA polymerase sigma factor (sigma-70 family)
MTPAEFAQAVEAHRPSLVRFACDRVRNLDEAEDLVQQALADAFGKVESFRGESALQTWLTGFVQNQIKRHWFEQRQRREREAETFATFLGLPRRDECGRRQVPAAAADAAMAEAARLPGQRAHHASHDPREAMDAGIRIDVRQAVETLPDDIRGVILDMYWRGQTWEEAAADLGINVRTLQRLVYPYIEKLRGLLVAYGP